MRNSCKVCFPWGHTAKVCRQHSVEIPIVKELMMNFFWKSSLNRWQLPVKVKSPSHCRLSVHSIFHLRRQTLISKIVRKLWEIHRKSLLVQGSTSSIGTCVNSGNTSKSIQENSRNSMERSIRESLFIVWRLALERQRTTLVGFHSFLSHQRRVFSLSVIS